MSRKKHKGSAPKPVQQEEVTPEERPEQKKGLVNKVVEQISNEADQQKEAERLYGAAMEELREFDNHLFEKYGLRIFATMNPTVVLRVPPK